MAVTGSPSPRLRRAANFLGRLHAILFAALIVTLVLAAVELAAYDDLPGPAELAQGGTGFFDQGYVFTGAMFYTFWGVAGYFFFLASAGLTCPHG